MTNRFYFEPDGNYGRADELVILDMDEQHPATESILDRMADSDRYEAVVMLSNGEATIDAQDCPDDKCGFVGYTIRVHSAPEEGGGYVWTCPACDADYDYIPEDDE